MPVANSIGKQGIKAVIIGITANALLAIVKLTAGIAGHSYALIADATESASDILTSLIVWVGLKAASKAPDSDHPYGHGKAEPIAAILVSLALILAAILIAVQSMRHLFIPHKAPAIYTLAILAGVIIVKEFLYRRTNKVAISIDSTAVKADAWHHRSDALTSFSVFIGIAIAIVGGPGYESADKWAALIASAIIVYNAIRIFNPAFKELMDGAPDKIFDERIRHIAAQVKGVRGLDKSRIRKTGFEYFVDLHVEVDGNISVREGHAIAHHVKDAIQKEMPYVYDVLVHIEPA